MGALETRFLWHPLGRKFLKVSKASYRREYEVYTLSLKCKGPSLPPPLLKFSKRAPKWTKQTQGIETIISVSWCFIWITQKRRKDLGLLLFRLSSLRSQPFFYLTFYCSQWCFRVCISIGLLYISFFRCIMFSGHWGEWHVRYSIKYVYIHQLFHHRKYK